VIDVAMVAAGAAEVRARIEAAGGDPERITLVAVTKAFGPDAVTAAVSAGLRDVGENYAQELTAKASELDDATAVRWHFIGQLQRNKVRAIAPFVHLWQSVDRLSLGEEIARRAPGAAVLVQVNAGGEPGKGGCALALAPGVVDGCRDLGLDVRGLMAVGPTAGGPEAAKPAFEAVRDLADRLGLAERSMGMTADLEVAVRAGSTMVRIGSALFGPRPPRAP
jgi:pyridoxal phosphate enzyme (YggS family)